MKKIILSSALIVAFFIYVILQNFSGSKNVKITPPASEPVAAAESSGRSGGSGNSNQSGQKNRNMMMKGMTGLYKDGSYTGSVADAYYGNVQVKAVIQSGKITDVQFLEYPSDRSTSVYINGQAMPYLTQEAIQSQNSNVDIVSGATETSLAFRESLASALTQAQS